ncbi:MAG: CDP-diacylglycerol--serine O-phosphatidyltransferase [Tannerellaceae bacterium]|jgi:CDP-diacylglycerol--serine O-phosphatidyltransferase|nr:CDP-diacylglycerol--serine O-phosphatidyltransferase [Tannerellaceae bacterium]
MSIGKHIPNGITCLNLFAGCMAVLAASAGDLQASANWVIAAAAFDFLDGFMARLLHAVSPVGKDLDSLADVVSFGLAPGMAVYQLLAGVTDTLLPFLAFLIPVCSALRLARFNHDSRQTDSFIGLPVPAHALFWTSAVCALSPLAVLHSTVLLSTVPVFLMFTSYLLISPLPMFSLKVKTWRFKGNESLYILLAASIVFTVLWGRLGVAGSILLYIAFNISRHLLP